MFVGVSNERLDEWIIHKLAKVTTTPDIFVEVVMNFHSLERASIFHMSVKTVFQVVG